MNERAQSQAAPAAKSSFAPVRHNLLQRKCACGGTPGLDGECAGCRRKRLLGSRSAPFDQADKEVPRSPDRSLDARTTLTSSEAIFGHDFSKVPVHDTAPVRIQPRLAVSSPEDPYEREANRKAEEVMRMPNLEADGLSPERKETSLGLVQREAALRHDPAGLPVPGSFADNLGSGQPLDAGARAFFEPRFGKDLSHVRIHTDRSADTAARTVGARAFTRGSDIVFRGDQYHPHTYAGRRLLAHELTHVVQQGAAPHIQQRSADENLGPPSQTSRKPTEMTGYVVQRWPGDGLHPPGDCSWVTYLPLRGSVETAKAVVSTLGACSPGDSCLFLASKIAAITAEIAARVALDTTCFRGGDTGHRQQVQDKINMMNRCYRFFSGSNRPPAPIAAMAVVVERAREVIAAAAVVVAVALVVALVAAIIAALIAALIVLLVTVKDALSDEDSPEA